MVQTRELTKVYRTRGLLGPLFGGDDRAKTVAVDRVSLHVDAGEIFGLVGPNGAGKTTLINLLSTLIIPTAGLACVGGCDVVKDPAGVRRLVGLVTSNERSFYWRLSGRENLRFFAQLQRISPRAISQRIEEILDALDLRAYAEARFDTYSTGIRQRLAIARALLHRPCILFMDEPTKGLDPTGAAALIRLVRERITQVWNPTIIITSHNLKEVEQLCNRIAVMIRGRIICCGNLDDLRRRVPKVEVYRLTIGKLPAGCLQAIAELKDVLRVREAQTERKAHEVELRGRNGVLSAVLRMVLSEGGEVYRCCEVPVSLEDVFTHIVSSTRES